jgi:exopolyphosphatase/guanosine-5'-triphosphate,3'-diphosphate pyrophosphatase
VRLIMPDRILSAGESLDNDGKEKPTKPRRRKNRSNSLGNKSPKKDHPLYAAIDLGTNNCRLLIARPVDGGFKVIDSYSKAVRLGVGLESTGLLSKESINNAVDALYVCAKKIKTHRVKRWRCVATEACRKALNGKYFLDRVKKETGLSLEIISPRVESRLAVMGCINLIDTTKNVALVVDIGGGSTELSWVDVRRLKDENLSTKIYRPPISAWASLPIGVVTLSERIPELNDRALWYENMKTVVRDEINKSNCKNRFVNIFNEGKGHIIGTSGTITSLAGIHLKLPYYQRDKVDGLWLRTSDAIKVSRYMSSLSPLERAKEPCIGEERANLLVAGCAITDVICEIWPSKIIRVADRGLREGMLMGLMQQKQKVTIANGLQYDRL